MVGKLRVRLCCVRPHEQLVGALFLLSERKKGAQQVGTADVQLQVIGMLSVCLAHLSCVTAHSLGCIDHMVLPMASQLCYASGKALLKSYLRPPLPEAAYSHGLADGALQETMSLEIRRIILRWLDAANPAIPKAVATAVLDTERCDHI